MSYRNTLLAFILFAAGLVMIVFALLLMEPARAHSPRDVICKADAKPMCVYRKRRAA